MKVLFILFLGAAGFTWFSIFGYLLILWWIAPRSRRTGQGKDSLPQIAVVIPVLNEADLISAKLADLRQTDYPHDRIAFLVVDGGSVDRTKDIVRHEISVDGRVQLECMEQARGKADQVALALGLLTQEIVVVTDADSTLEPSCIQELVSMLAHDTQTAVVGAVVEPDSVLLEERMHWWFLNRLWWLEGEILSAAPLSGVCYACRRQAALPLSSDARTEDIHLALAAGARGFRVRICWPARAVELRVPQTLGDILRYRRRRGAAYLFELRRTPKTAQTPLAWRLARVMRLWHFIVTPKVAVGLTLSGCILLGTGHWPFPFLAFTAFVLPILVALFSSPMLSEDKHRRWKLTLAAARLLALTLASMLTLKSHPTDQSPIGGRS